MKRSELYSDYRINGDDPKNYKKTVNKQKLMNAYGPEYDNIVKQKRQPRPNNSGDNVTYSENFTNEQFFQDIDKRNFLKKSNAAELNVLWNIRNDIMQFNNRNMVSKPAFISEEQLIINTKQMVLNSNNAPEIVYICNVYERLYDLHAYTKTFSEIVHQNATLKEVRKIFSPLKNAHNALADFVMKNPHLSESELVLKSFYLLELISSELTIILGIALERDHRRKIIGFTFGIIIAIILCVILVIITLIEKGII